MPMPAHRPSTTTQALPAEAEVEDNALRTEAQASDDPDPALALPPAAESDQSGPRLEPQDRRLLELYLLHHYTTVVAPLFPTESGQASQRPIYSVEAVRLAFQHECLLAAIFAVSSLHIALEVIEGRVTYSNEHSLDVEPGQARGGDLVKTHPVPAALSHVNMRETHHFYLQSALQFQQQALMAISAANAESLALTSILISIAAMHLQESSVAYRPPTQYLNLSRGIRSTVTAAHSMSFHGHILSDLLSADRVKYTPGRSDMDVLFDPVNVGPFAPILEFQKCLTSAPRNGPGPVFPGTSTPPEIQSTLSQTVALVGSIHAAFLRDEPPYQLSRRVTAFPTLAPAAYLSLVASMHPCALVILAHYFAMTTPLARHYWFFRGVAQREVRGIAGALPTEWDWAMSWPSKVCETGDVVGEGTDEILRQYGTCAGMGGGEVECG
ncbi:hypothetical protein A1O3_10280 [Capronia epimyces CBS 606.96]|uniref:Transcription factor domain-containing protein n=1 Tax=Capronia epimyces CBS 606.96 TaxID=1182542 RepID=W9X9H4_9EURO|nr:uncharacterized protein A1O3_10280 [Capronia epimyces CBS 606.96]EXJ77122.1 hypothetical protein A1O3_10280 [Capronia epimyces CBS 606.96]